MMTSLRSSCLAATSVVAAAALLPGCSLVTETPAEKGNVCGDPDTAVSARDYAVTTSDTRATQVACRVLSEGGSAADAVVAAQSVLGLVEPQSSGPGGGAVAVYHEADGDTTTYDATVHAPAKETGTGKLDSVGVPQTMTLLKQLNDDHGRRKLDDLTAPARQLATDGFEVTDRLADAARSREKGNHDLKGTFLGTPEAGDTLTNPDYATFLGDWAGDDLDASRLDVGGHSQAFADEWADDLTADVEPEEPLCTDYHDHQICGSPSTSGGNMVVAETLGLLRSTDINGREPYLNGGIPVAKTDAAQFMVEAERIAFADANTWMGDEAGDPGRARAYRDHLVTDNDYLRERAGHIDQHKAMKTPEPGRIPGYGTKYHDFFDEGTTHISVIDADGNAASVTSTLQRNFGSGVAVNGFFLNNSLDNFTRDAEHDEPNARTPGAKPKTLMSPLVILHDGKLTGVVGSPGGSRIPGYLVKAVVGLIDWSLDPAEVVAMPNFGADNRDRVFLERTDTTDLEDMDRMEKVLDKRGHNVNLTGAPSGIGAITAHDGHLESSGDPRRDGAAQGGTGGS